MAVNSWEGWVEQPFILKLEGGCVDREVAFMVQKDWAVVGRNPSKVMGYGVSLGVNRMGVD